MVNRLLGILYILLKKETVTAAELAQRFEVSVRTIYRDVETLSMAGIPVYARKGKNGGVSLTKQFVMDRMLVTKEEQQQILAALESLNQVGAGEDEILQKLGGLFQMESPDWVEVDFSDWSGQRQDLFEVLKKAVLGHQVLEFDYYGQCGEMSHRQVEPLRLVFKDYTWYLKAWCRERQALRIFKVLRMKRVQTTGEIFLPEPEKYREQELPGEAVLESPQCTEVVLRIASGEAYRVYDRFEENEIRVLENRDFEIHMHCLLDDWVYGMIFSFGPAAEVLAPEEVRQEATKRLREMAEKYR